MSGGADRSDASRENGRCPGLSTSTSWDDAASLRGEILTTDQLKEHAAEIARAEGVPTLKVTAGPLKARFTAARAAIRETYAVLGREARKQHEPSPAEEWLLDNSHVVEEQLREIEQDLPWGYLVELPRLHEGPMTGYPRVYGLGLDYLRHSDARIDVDTLASYVEAYQTQAPLTIGELWAIPIMLRLGLVLTVGALAASEVHDDDRANADEFAERFLVDGQRPSRTRAALDELEGGEGVSAAFIVQLLRYLRAHEAPPGELLEWIHARCAELGSTPEELSRREHLRRAADQVSVGNAITSMRAIGALDWNAFFERTSFVEDILRNDPVSAYANMDEASRDRYRHAVEDLARRSSVDERRVAEVAIEMATASREKAPDDVGKAHVGFYLVDAGRSDLEAAIGYRPKARERLTRALVDHPTLFYVGSLGLMTALFVAVFISLTATHTAARLPLFVALALLASLPASSIALALLNGFVTAILPPRLLPKLALLKGVQKENETLVVVPALLDSKDGIARLLGDLEVRSLANPDRFLHFALVTDFVDADTEERAGDADLLDCAMRGIAELNRRDHAGDGMRFFLFHRRRLHNPSEGCWMGWERKRGKIEELNRLLRGATDTSFVVATAPLELLADIRYVITLDADTDLPRDVGRRLVATMAHPLNQPWFDPKSGAVVRGYGLVQPRVGTRPSSSRRSILARTMAGPPGIDPYTTAISDVYQDLFGEGSFVGKGIYDVDCFMRALEGRVPENRLLSHDLFEGLFARTALASDIEVLDDHPAAYAVGAGRQHRWVRGDWQLLSWLGFTVPLRGGARRRNDLSFAARWRLFDNLRRSLVPPASVALLVVAWFTSGAIAAAATAAMLVAFSAPLLGRVAVAVMRPSNDRAPSFLDALRADARGAVLQILFNVVFLLDRTLIQLDAIGRTLYRLYVSKRLLLEWQTTNDAERRHAKGRRTLDRRLWAGTALSLVCMFAVAYRSLHALPFAAPMLLLWMAAPLVAARISRPEPPKTAAVVSPEDRLYLRLVARRTWRFFEEFVTEQHHYLPPDNFQEDPQGVVAPRTSPTNIGLYLLSTVAARDLGFIALSELTDRLEKTLSTVEKLERREGHILNWFDTVTLRPLDPMYVSTVDSGNLAGYLVALREACADLQHAPIAGPNTFDGALDAVRIANETGDAGATALEQRILRAKAAIPPSGSLASVANSIREILASVPASTVGWQAEAARSLRSAGKEIATLAPWTSLLDKAPQALLQEGIREAWSEIEQSLERACSLAAIATLGAELDAKLDALTGTLLGLRATVRSDSIDENLAFVADLRELLERAHEASAAQCGRLVAIGERAAALADGMNFAFLYDNDRSLFSIGYNVGSARLDSSHYDLLASEARLASLFAIAKGDVPQVHWFRMARPRTGLANGQRVLMSWSGSMFEYLMPLLVTKGYAGTLLDETYESVIAKQRDYGEKQGVPWGISEAAYNTMDLSMIYQYRAFGVPGLGFKAGLGEDLVVAPYATSLAALVHPDLAADNLRALAREGLVGKYGFYESIDYTPAHVPPGRRSVVVKAFMAHHQGMTLVALDNVLNDSPMQHRFHRDPRIKATALLLQERVPVGTPLVEPSSALVPVPPAVDAHVDVVDHVGLGADGPLRMHLLGHGELSTLVAVTGAGATTWKDLDINRYREDASIEGGGISIYVRKVESGDFWSAGYHPARVEPEAYDVAFSSDKVEIRRRDGDIETVTEVVVSPERPAEVRRITVTNHGTLPCEIEVTTYTEVVLQPRAADIAHRAFGGLFIETEALPERGALLAHRRPRSKDEVECWLVQILAPEEHPWSDLTFDSSRPAFVGRGGSLERPAAMIDSTSLSASVGAVLDPALVLRRRVRLLPGEKARLALTTAIAPTRESASELVDFFGAPHCVARTFELGWADARVELRHLGITSSQAQRFQRLLSAILSPVPAHRSPTQATNRGGGKRSLWAHGISADLPILILELDQTEIAELCREVLLAHEFWRLNGMQIDLVIVNQEESGYLQPLNDEVLGLLRGSPAQSRLNQRGGVFVIRADQMNDEDRALLSSAGRVVLRASQGSLGRQLKRSAPRALPEKAVWRGKNGTPRRQEPALPPSRFPNGIGGFSDDGSEYVMDVGPHARTPAPWSNVIGIGDFGSLVTESGLGFTWAVNSQSHRLTPWSNDPVCDPSGEVLYLRDEAGEVWSATPMPAGGTARYVVRHGHGYSVFEHQRGDLAHELTVFVDPNDPVKVCRLKVHNRGKTARRLTATGVVEWVLGTDRDRTKLSVVTEWVAESKTVIAHDLFGASPTRRAFFTTTGAVASFTADRAEFYGSSGSRVRPAAQDRVALSNRAGHNLDPCAALSVPIEIAPGATAEVSFILGEAPSEERARELAASYCDAAHVATSYSAAKGFWSGMLGAITVKTPDGDLDHLLNGWMLYQTLSCRFWGRSAFYQSGGAYGFRDQLQDCLALLHVRPDLTRSHILTSAARQFVEGDVQHWWHPDTGEGVRTRCSDDLLWLPYVTAEYVRATGDRSILDETRPFLEERALKPEDNDVFGVPAVSRESASLYDHCTRAIDAATGRGQHGLPLMRGGDWNDGMNRVGAEGKGESIWLAWFLAKTLRDFAPLATARGDLARAERCDVDATQIARAIEAHGWDGEWYLRGYFDDGTPLGGKEAAECRIDAIAQSWAVIAGVGDPARAARALLASEGLLFREHDQMMLLFWPPFDKTEKDPGYIRAYPPGVRENGGQYTHGVLWSALAAAMMGDGARAASLLHTFSPSHHAETPEAVARYRVEPYVVVADVYASQGHIGEGGWTWYTGSAGWMYRIALENLLGIQLEGGRLRLAPCIPPAWRRYEVTIRRGQSSLHIVVENPLGVSRGIQRIELDDKPVRTGTIDLIDDGRAHEVRVVLGRGEAQEFSLAASQ